MSTQTYEDIINIREFLFYFFGLLGIAIFRLLGWLMPKTAKFVWEALMMKLKAFQAENNKEIISKQEEIIAKQEQMTITIAKLNESVDKYKFEKHKIEGELSEAKDAILNDDKEKLAVLHDHYLEEKNASINK